MTGGGGANVQSEPTISLRALRATYLVVAEHSRGHNGRGTFDNLGDTQEGIGEIREASFERVELETVGSMAIFAATNPRTNPSTGMTP